MFQSNEPLKLALLLALIVGSVGAVQASPSDPTIQQAQQAAAVTENTAFTLEARQEALRQLQEAARLFLLADESVAAARVLNRVGRLQFILNTPQAAVDSHNQALSLLKQTPALEVEVDNLNGLANALLTLQKLGEAEALVQRAITLSKRSSYVPGQAEALITLSFRQNYQNHIVALTTAQEALTLWQTLNNKAGLAQSYAQIGQYYMAQNMLPEATQNYQTALQLWEELQDKSGQAGALIGLGFIEFRKGSWQGAITSHTRAQELIDEKAEPKRMGQIASGLAEAFNESGLPEQALVHYQRALTYYQQIQDSAFVAYAMWGIGCTYYFLGKYVEAVTELNRALAEVSDDSIQAAQCYEFLGRVHIATRESELALPYLQSALATYTRTINPKEAAQVQGLMGEVYQQQGRIKRARQYYQQSLQTFVRLSDHLNEAAILFALGRLELRQDNLELAEGYLRRSIDATENIRRVSTISDLTAAFSATVHERYESYIECLMRKHQAHGDRGLAELAFETSELARARSLTELLRATQTNLVPGLEPQLAEQERSLRQSLRVKEDHKVALLAKDYKKDELDALNSELAGLESNYKQVTETIRARYPAYGQINQPTVWSLSQIQEQVVADDQTLVLEYSLGMERSYVWAVTRQRITSYELKSEAQINDAARKVYQLLATAGDAPHEHELTDAVRDLGQLILLPVAGELKKKRVIVVADGALHYIPFQILPVSSANDEPLIAHTEIINAPSASILGQLAMETAQRQTAPHLLAAFGDPIFPTDYVGGKQPAPSELVASVQAERRTQAFRDIQPEGDSSDPQAFQSLFFCKRELANLVNVAGPETFVATGFDATREKLASANLANYAILHIATHGVLDPKRPEISGLLLSTIDRKGNPQNGFFALQDIYALRAPVDLVVLSACRTGLGKEVSGEGLIGLTRGFMYAGASSVVASLWTVDDEATAELMKRFYANMLERDMNASAALQAAQNSIRQEPQWRSPYFWAAFTLQGEYRRVIKPARSGFTIGTLPLAMGASAILLAVILGWWYRRTRQSVAYSTITR